MMANKGSNADPVLAVLEAAGERSWHRDFRDVYEPGPHHAARTTAEGMTGQHNAAAIVRAVNTFAGAREALRAVLAMPVEGLTHEMRAAFDKARTALDAMEGRTKP